AGDVDAAFDPLQAGVLQGGLRAVAAQVDSAPEVDADGPAGGQAPGGADQQEPAPAADVEDGLVAAPGDQVEEPFAPAELADLAVPEHPAGVGQAVESGQEQDLGQGDAQGVRGAQRDQEGGHAEGGQRRDELDGEHGG